MDDVEITNLVYRCAAHIDDRELDLAAELFSDARVKLQHDGDYLNHEELLSAWKREFFGSAEERPGTQHLITNPIVVIDKAGGTATCRSNYTVLRVKDRQPLQLSASGRYRDEFVYLDGRWRFSMRECEPFDTAGTESELQAQIAAGQTTPNKRDSASPTKKRILVAAQQVFSTVGYSEAGIRKIADAVGLSPTILFRHFGTKANLFEEALVAAMGEPKRPASKEQFGQYIADKLGDPTQPNCPHAMTVLATGNEEAREIAIRVLREYAIMPMIEWLGPPNAESRAREIMAICAGFVLYNAQLNISSQKAIDPHMVNWLAQSIQTIVDEE